MKTHTLRPALPSDHDWLWSLQRVTMRDYVIKTWGHWDEVDQLRRFKERFNPGNWEIIVHDSRDAGVVHIERSAQEIHLVNIQIAPEFQNQRLGTAVMDGLLAEAKKRGISLRLQVMRANPARRLYERLGFTVVDESETHYQMRCSP